MLELSVQAYSLEEPTNNLRMTVRHAKLYHIQDSNTTGVCAMVATGAYEPRVEFSWQWCQLW